MMHLQKWHAICQAICQIPLTGDSLEFSQTYEMEEVMNLSPIPYESFRSSSSIKAFLQDITIFSELTEEELNRLVEAAIETCYSAGDRIIRKEKDETEASIFIIRSGRVRVVLEKEGTKDVYLSTLKEKEFFGELSIFNGKPQTATVIAELDTKVIEIKRSSFVGEIYRKPEIALKVLSEMATRLRRSDEKIGELADRVYDEAYPKLEGALSAQLDAAKTIYAKTEDRADKTLHDVEQSWKNFARFVTLILCVISVVGSLLAFFGFKTFHDVKTTAMEIAEAKQEAKTKLSEITRLTKEAQNAVIVRDILLSIGKVRHDLKLGETVDESNREQIRQFAIAFGPAEKKLYNEYLIHFEEIDPEVTAAAAAAYVELVIRAGYTLPAERIRVLVGAIVHVLRQTTWKNWRRKLKGREMIIALSNANGLGYRVTVLEQMKEVVRDKEAYLHHVRHDAALVMAELGLINKAASKVLIDSMSLKKDPFIQFAAATRLAMMGDSKGWEKLSGAITQPGMPGFVAAYMLGELGRDELTSMGVKDRLTVGEDRDPFLTIADRIQQGLDDVKAEMRREINPYMRKYAQMIIRELLPFYIPSTGEINFSLPSTGHGQRWHPLK